MEELVNSGVAERSKAGSGDGSEAFSVAAGAVPCGIPGAEPRWPVGSRFRNPLKMLAFCG